MKATKEFSSCDPTCILLTGASGFLGKVVLEELCRRRKEFNLAKVVTIIRPKRGKDARSRFMSDIFPSACFSKLPEKWESPVLVVEGELSQPNCGVNVVEYQKICTEVTHVIHCAGSISFNAPLDESIKANVDATLNVYELARNCLNLQQFVSTSTAYVAPHTAEPLLEVLVPLPMSAKELLESIERKEIDEVEVLQLTGHPNTYTFTKCITEHLILDQQNDITVTIVRPSIISASRIFPFPGWIDSSAALAAFIAAYGAGILHVIDGNPEVLADIVPVDDVANKLIDEAFLMDQGLRSHRISHAVATLKHGIKIGAVSDIVQNYFQKQPGCRVTKIHYLGARNILFHLRDIFHQKLPLWFGLMFHALRKDAQMAEQTRRAIKLINSINEVFPTFTNHTYDFRSSVSLIHGSDIGEYLDLVCRGVDVHLLRRQ